MKKFAAGLFVIFLVAVLFLYVNHTEAKECDDIKATLNSALKNSVTCQSANDCIEFRGPACGGYVNKDANIELLEKLYNSYYIKCYGEDIRFLIDCALLPPSECVNNKCSYKRPYEPYTNLSERL